MFISCFINARVFVVSCSFRSLLIKFMEPSYASIDYGRLERSLLVFLLRLVKYRYRSMFVIAISSHNIYIYIVLRCSLVFTSMCDNLNRNSGGFARFDFCREFNIILGCYYCV